MEGRGFCSAVGNPIAPSPHRRVPTTDSTGRGQQAAGWHSLPLDSRPPGAGAQRAKPDVRAQRQPWGLTVLISARRGPGLWAGPKLGWCARARGARSSGHAA